MKRQKASSIYFTVTCFTVQCTCHEKIYIFTFKIKIDHQLIISPGPLLQKLKWLSHLWFTWTYLCWRNKRIAVLKEKVYSVPNVCAVEALPQVALKQNKHNSVDPIIIQCVIASTVPSPGQSSLKELYNGTATWSFPYCSSQIPNQASVLWSSVV